MRPFDETIHPSFRLATLQQKGCLFFGLLIIVIAIKKYRIYYLHLFNSVISLEYAETYRTLTLAAFVKYSFAFA